MRRILEWVCAATLVLAVAACDEKDEKGKSKTGGGNVAIDERVEKYCDDADEFADKVADDPTNTDLFDEGEALIEDGQDLEADIPEEVDDPEDAAELADNVLMCGTKVGEGLADIEVEPDAS